MEMQATPNSVHTKAGHGQHVVAYAQSGDISVPNGGVHCTPGASGREGGPKQNGGEAPLRASYDNTNIVEHGNGGAGRGERRPETDQSGGTILKPYAPISATG